MKTMTCCDIDPRTMSREEALTLSDADKIKYFKLVRLKHPRIAETLNEMTLRATSDMGKGIVLLIGPTGVGKSTLIKTLGEQMISRERAEIDADPSYVPVAMMVAPASGGPGFSWKMFYSVLGKALREPLMEKKLETRIEGDKTFVRLPGSGSTLAGMKLAVADIIKSRRTKLVVVDEAVPMLRPAPGNSLENHMDTIKTMVDNDMTLVLVGSYDLLELASKGDQVARRSAIVHFRRYLTGIPEDERAFRKALQQLQKFMPLQDMPDLTDRALELQTTCIGCVGILKTVLLSTLNSALHNGGKWSESHLEKAQFSRAQFTKIMTATLSGEASIQDSELGSGTFEALMAQAKLIETMRRGIA